MAKRNRPRFLNRKPKFARRVTKNGERVWLTLDGKQIFKTKREYFAMFEKLEIKAEQAKKNVITQE